MAWKYPLSDVDVGLDEIQALTEIIHAKWLSQGPKTAEFEQRFAEYLGCRHAAAISSCTAALHLALAALDIGPGDEVLLPSYTFVATANSVLYQRATPVLIDVVGENDLNLDPADLERKISPRSKAILVVHLAGFPCDMDWVMKIAGKHGLPVIEDACHAIGATYAGQMDSPYAGRRAGTIGNIGCFSFFANKNLPVGEGGMLVTDDEQIAARVRLLRSHGMTRSSWEKASGLATDYDVLELGYNYRITEFASALGLTQLEKLDRHNATRRQLVARYRKRLQGLSGIAIPFASRLADSSHHIFPVLVEPEQRSTFRKQLAERGIQTSVHYPPIHHFSHFRRLFPQAVVLPQTESLTAREVTLPLHPLMTCDDIDDIVSNVADVIGNCTNAAR